jgi:hypothetical protein
MKKIINKNILSVVLFSIIFILSCSGMKDQIVKSEGAKYNFVFLSDYTSFKEKINQQLIEKYKKQANIDLLDLKKFRDIDPKKYNVILIMDYCSAGSPSTDAAATFAKNPEDKNKIVFFVSVGNGTLQHNSSGVDAVSSASKLDKVDNIVAEISKKIDQIISKN